MMDRDDYISLDDLTKQHQKEKKKDVTTIGDVFSKLGRETTKAIKFVEGSVKDYSKSDSWKKTKKYLAGVQKNFEEQSKGSKTIEDSMKPIIGGIK